jgi:hypothetical protein
MFARWKKLESRSFIYLDGDSLLQQRVSVSTSTVKECLDGASGEAYGVNLSFNRKTVKTSELRSLLEATSQVGEDARKAFAVFLYNEIMPELAVIDLKKQLQKVLRKGGYCQLKSEIRYEKMINKLVRFPDNVFHEQLVMKRDGFLVPEKRRGLLFKKTESWEREQRPSLFLNFITKNRFELGGHPYEDPSSGRPITPILAKGKIKKKWVFDPLHPSGKSFRDLDSQWPGAISLKGAFTVEGQVIDYDKCGPALIPSLELIPLAIYR